MPRKELIKKLRSLSIFFGLFWMSALLFATWMLREEGFIGAYASALLVLLCGFILGATCALYWIAGDLIRNSDAKCKKSEASS